MKKTMKIVSILLIALLMISIATSVFAATDDEKSEVKALTGPKDMMNDQIDVSNTNSIQTIGGRIIGIIQVIGNIVAIAMIVVIGIKYMMGSAEEKAEYKKTLFPYFVGAILIFAASNLAQMIYNWASTVSAG